VGLTLLAAVATIWLVFIAVNTLRGRAWVRGAALTWQVFQVVIGVGCLQGLFATPTVGWLLIAAAVVVVVLLFTPPVVAATRDREPPGQS
jgi:heme A synthase